MIRTIAAVVFGTVLAIVLIIVVERLSHIAYPMPASLDMTDEAAMKAYFGSVPIGALLFVGIAWMTGTFGGGMLATFIAKESAITNCAIIGSLVMFGTIMNLISIPHPAWFSIAAVIAIIATTFVTSKLAARFVSDDHEHPAEQNTS